MLEKKTTNSAKTNLKEKLDTLNRVVNIISKIVVVGMIIYGVLTYFYKIRSDVDSLITRVKKVENKIESLTNMKSELYVTKNKIEEIIRSDVDSLITRVKKVENKIESLTNMKSELYVTKNKIEEIENRIDRIVAVFPEVEIRIAEEEINRPLEGFVFFTKRRSGVSGISAIVYNRNKRRLILYKIKNNYVPYIIRGKLESEYPYYKITPLSKLVEYSKKLKLYTQLYKLSLEDLVDEKTSFVIYPPISIEVVTKEFPKNSTEKVYETEIVEIKSWNEFLNRNREINEAFRRLPVLVCP